MVNVTIKEQIYGRADNTARQNKFVRASLLLYAKYLWASIK